MFLIVALPREDANLPRVECGRPFPVRDDHGIWVNLLWPVELFGREKQPDGCCHAAFAWSSQSRSHAVTSSTRRPSPACSPALTYSDLLPQGPHSASISSAPGENLCSNLGMKKAFQSWTQNLKAMKRKMINLIALKIFYETKSKSSIKKTNEKQGRKNYCNSKGKGLAAII